MKIEKAKKKDFEAINTLFKELFPKEKFSKKKVQSIYEKQLKSSNHLNYVMRKDEGIIAYVAAGFREDIQSQGKVAYLSELIVTRKERGQGHGKKLLEHLMKEAKKKKCVEVQFPSTFKRTLAHKFYKKLGFKKTAYFFWKEI